MKVNGISDGGQAFPSNSGGGDFGLRPVAGMTLRDYFAGQALAGMMANCDDNGINSWLYDAASRHAYCLADAMLAARNLVQE